MIEKKMDTCKIKLQILIDDLMRDKLLKIFS